MNQPTADYPPPSEASLGPERKWATPDFVGFFLALLLGAFVFGGILLWQSGALEDQAVPFWGKLAAALHGYWPGVLGAFLLAMLAQAFLFYRTGVRERRLFAEKQWLQVQLQTAGLVKPPELKTEIAVALPASAKAASQSAPEAQWEAQKMDAVGRLAGGIAHDFNNVLTAILGYTDLLIGQINERHWMFKHLSEIRKAADFAASLTQQLLAFSRRQPLYARVFRMNETVTGLDKMLRRLLGEMVTIETQLQPDLGWVKADSSQIEQVLLNLCVNARDAMPGGGRITITTEDVTHAIVDLAPVGSMPAGEYVRLTVSDTGEGMSPEVQKQIFEPFFTTKENGKGTGLGLATCYGIITQSGGFIEVESAPGKGARFSVYLPRVARPEPEAPGALRLEKPRFLGGQETVLYVEDEATVRSVTAHVLRQLGYTVLEAGDGREAGAVLKAHGGQAVHLLFADVVLPDGGGKRLVELMRKHDSRTRVLFTSGYTDESILREHGLERGAAFLQKPFTPDELARAVREVIDCAPVH